MAKKKINELIEKFAREKVLNENLEEIFSERFSRYSKYIIQDRALPDARDGLKPVQRRILYAMFKLGIFHNSTYKKSARIVGEVIGKYHPHGDTSVYEALVRMSQTFKMRLPLIDMHGNNGSIDGDGAAAMRYTEARLSNYAEYLLQDLNKKTVGFVPNFDDEEYEPVVLPAKYPALLVNGSTGISAGYATDIPPHNIDEIINAVIYRINHPRCTLKDLMKIVKGPDFPTGGIVQGGEEIEKALKTGKGKVVVKSKTEIVEGDKINQLVITEIPYEVVKANLVKKMNDAYVAKNVNGIIDIRDESDRHGLRIVVDIKKEANPEYIRDFFFKATDLQINYTYNMVAIADKRPVTLGLIDALDYYIEHQKEVITNRSNFELKTAKARLHIVEGLIAMVSILDAVIKTIRESSNKKNAKENLMSNYSFTEMQAEAIVMLQLYRLTNTDIVALRNEQDELKKRIVELEEILSNESKLLNVIIKELNQTLKQLSSPRKTVIQSEIDELVVEEGNLIQKEDVHLLITNDGYIKKISTKHYKLEEEHKYKENDFLVNEYLGTTVDVLLLFTNKGNYVYLPVSKIPDVRHKDLGYNVSTLANIASDEKIMFSFPVTDFEEEKYVLFATKKGLIKRTIIKEFKATRYSNALMATKINFAGGDELINVDVCDKENNEVIVVTKEGFINRYDSKEISVYAPASLGVKSVELKSRPNDEVVLARYVNSAKDLIICLLQKGTMKRIKVEEVFKGHKNNVGKSMIAMTKTSPNYVVGGEIIHKTNLNENLPAYVIGAKATAPLDFANLKSSNPTIGRTITMSALGKAQSIIIKKNDNDLNK